jgi:hypothetical protein
MTETEDERHARLNAEIFRRKAMTPEQRKNEDLDELYEVDEISVLQNEMICGHDYRNRAIPSIALRLQFERRAAPCRNKNCGHQIRTPCKLLQYLEQCAKCGERYGEDHN